MSLWQPAGHSLDRLELWQPSIRMTCSVCLVLMQFTGDNEHTVVSNEIFRPNQLEIIVYVHSSSEAVKSGDTTVIAVLVQIKQPWRPTLCKNSTFPATRCSMKRGRCLSCNMQGGASDQICDELHDAQASDVPAPLAACP